MNVFDLYASLSLDTKNYENALQGAESKGSNFGAGLGKAVKIGGAAVAAFGAAVVGGGSAIVKASGNLAEYGDNIDKMSQKMGISAKAYQEWDAVLQHSGVSIDSLLPSMKTLSTQAQKGNDAFQKLGITQEEVATLSKEDLFAKTIEGLQNMEEGTERTAIASQLLGRGATELGALLNTSAEDTQKMKDKVNELGGVMSDEAVKSAAAFQDQLQDMQTAFQGASRSMLSNFLPGLTKVMGGITDLFSGKGGTEKIAEGINSIATKIQQAIPKIVEVGGSIIKGLAKSITDNMPVLMEGVKSVINSIIEVLPDLTTMIGELVPQLAQTLIDMLPTMVEAGIQLLGGLIEGITEAIPTLLETLPDLLESVANTIIDSLPMIIEMGVQLIVSLADGIMKALPKLIEKVPTIIENLIQAIVSNIPLIVDAGVQLLTSLVTNLPQIIVEVVKAIPKIIASMVKGTIQGVGQMAKAGFDLLVGLVGRITEATSKVVSNIPKVISSIIKAFTNAPAQMAEVGSNLIKGLWNGIKNVTGWITDKIKGFANGVLKSIKGFFGIHSPSKVFEDEIGKMLGLGMAEGIEDSVDDVNSAMDDLMTVPEKYDFGKVSVSKSVEVSGTQASTMEKIQAQLDAITQLLPTLANANIVLDTGALVGQTVGAYNDALGGLILAEGRSV